VHWPWRHSRLSEEERQGLMDWRLCRLDAVGQKVYREFDLWEEQRIRSGRFLFWPRRQLRELRQAKRRLEQARLEYRRTDRSIRPLRKKEEPPCGWGTEYLFGPHVGLSAGAPASDGVLRALRYARSLPPNETIGLQWISIVHVKGEKFTWRDSRKRRHRSSTAGEYFPADHAAPAYICIYRDGQESCRYVVTHEVGHHVYRRVHSLPDRLCPGKTLGQSWDEFWEAQRRGPPFGRLPTNYSTRNADEGFAEVYGCLRNGGRLGRETRQTMARILEQLNSAEDLSPVTAAPESAQH